MFCNSLQQPELASSISNMFLCALEIRHKSVLKNIGGATASPAPPASWGPTLPLAQKEHYTPNTILAPTSLRSELLVFMKMLVYDIFIYANFIEQFLLDCLRWR